MESPREAQEQRFWRGKILLTHFPPQRSQEESGRKSHIDYWITRYKAPMRFHIDKAAS